MDVWVKGKTMVATYDVKLDTAEAIRSGVGWRVKESGSGPYDCGDVGEMRGPSGM